MALIKKYQSGNKIEEPDFNQYISKELLAGKFDKKKAKDVEDYLNSGKSVDWIEQEKSNYKPATRTVKVDVRREKEIGDLWDYVIANRYGGDEGSFIDDWEQQDNPEREKRLWDYISEISSKYLKDQSEDTVGHTWDNVEDVQNLTNIIADGYSPEAVKRLFEASNKLGWGVNRFFLSEEELAAAQQEKEAQAAEEQTKIDVERRQQELGDISANLQNIGMAKELADQYAQAGVVFDEEYEPSSDVTFMSDYAKQQGISVLRLPDGSRMFYKDGQPLTNFGGYISEDVFDPNYGRSFQITDRGFKLFEPSQREQNEYIIDAYEDPGNVRRRLEFEDPLYEEFQYFGESGDDFAGNWNIDALGRRDFLQRIQRIRPSGESDWLTRTDQGYVDSLGNITNIPSFTAYGESEELKQGEIDSLFNNPQSMMYGIDAINPVRFANQTIKGLEVEISSLEKAPKVGETFESSTRIKKRSRDTAGMARWFLENGTDEQKEKAREILSRLIKLSAEYSDVDSEGNVVKGFLKKGGVIKAEKGITTTDLAELNKKYYRSVVKKEETEIEGKEPKNTKEKPKVRDISGTLKDELQQTASNPLKAASAAGVVASFIPGVGLVGGLVTTAADSAQAVGREWTKDDTTRLLSNLAFSGLAAVGLGGTRALRGVSKAAKVAKKTAKVTSKADKPVEMIAKATKRADKFGIQQLKEPTERLTQLTGKLGKNANEALETVFKSGKPVTTSSLPDLDLTKAAKGIYKSGNKPLEGVKLKEAIVSDLNKVIDINKASTSAITSYAKRNVEPAVNLVKDIINKSPRFLATAGRTTLAGANIASAGTGLMDVAGSVVEEGHLGRGIMYADAASAQRLAFGLAGLRGVLRNRRNARELETYANRKTSNKIKIGDKEYETRGLFKSKKSRFEKADTRTKKDSEHFKKYLEENLVLGEGVNRESTIKELVDAVAEGVGYTTTPASGWQLNPNMDYGTDLYKARQIRNRIERMIETGVSNTFLPSYRRRYKKGGVIKGKRGLRTDYNEWFSNIGDYENKAVNPGTLPYTSTSNIGSNWQYDSGYTPVYQRLINQIDDNFYNKHIGSITNFVNKQGGTYIPKDAADLRRLMGDNKYGPIHNWVLNTFGNVSPVEKVTGLNSSQISAIGIDTIPTYSGINTYQNVANLPTIRSESPTSFADSANPSGYQDLTLKDFPITAYTPKKYQGWTPLLTETLKFASTNRYNKEALRHALASLNVPKLSKIPYSYERTSQINRNIAEEQAGQLQSIAGRIAESTSDIDRGNAIRLEAARQRAGIISEGAYRDLETNRSILDNQQRRNYQTLLTNLQQTDKENAALTEAENRMNQLRFNETLARQASMNNYLSWLGKFAHERPYKKALHEYSELQTDPNIQTLQEAYNYMQTEGYQKYKDLYEQDTSWNKESTFEESQAYQDWLNEMNSIKDKLTAVSSRLQGVLNKVIGQRSLLQKGGRIPLSEKVTLENVKYNHKRLLKNEDNFLKNILENNKMYQKAFIKVFK